MRVYIPQKIRPLESYLWYHYNDVIMGAIASQITSLIIVYSIIIQTQIKEIIKAPRHWPLCEDFTGDWWIPRTNGQLYIYMQKMFPFDDIILKSAVVQIIRDDRPLSKPVIMMLTSANVICWSWLWLTLNNSNHMFSHIWPDRIRHFDQISDLMWPRRIMA